MNQRMTITEVADVVGISPKTIVRWEKVGKVKKQNAIGEAGEFMTRMTWIILSNFMKRYSLTQIPTDCKVISELSELK